MNKEKKQIYYFERYYLPKKIIKWQDFFNIFASFLVEDCYYYKLDIYFPKKEYRDLKNLFGIFPQDQQGKDDILREIVKWIEKVSAANCQAGFDFYLYDSRDYDYENWKFQINDNLVETFINCTESEFLKFQKHLEKNNLPTDLFYLESKNIILPASSKNKFANMLLRKFSFQQYFSPKEYEEYLSKKNK